MPPDCNWDSIKTLEDFFHLVDAVAVENGQAYAHRLDFWPTLGYMSARDRLGDSLSGFPSWQLAGSCEPGDERVASCQAPNHGRLLAVPASHMTGVSLPTRSGWVWTARNCRPSFLLRRLDLSPSTIGQGTFRLLEAGSQRLLPN